MNHNELDRVGVLIPDAPYEEGVTFLNRKDLIIHSRSRIIEMYIREDLNSIDIDTQADGQLRIHGNVGGYKSRIMAPNLDILIHGNIDTSGIFLHKTSMFRRMDVFGNAYSNGCPFAGLFDGELHIHGTTPNYDITDPRMRRCYAFRDYFFGLRRRIGTLDLETPFRDKVPDPGPKAYVWIAGKQVLSRGDYVPQIDQITSI